MIYMNNVVCTPRLHVVVDLLACCNSCSSKHMIYVNNVVCRLCACNELLGCPRLGWSCLDIFH